MFLRRDCLNIFLSGSLGIGETYLLTKMALKNQHYRKKNKIKENFNIKARFYLLVIWHWQNRSAFKKADGPFCL